MLLRELALVLETIGLITMLGHAALAFLAPALLFGVGTHAEGLYSKKSAVLQVDGKSYDKLVAKSNQVSVTSIWSIISLLAC